jgi:hypothetical protein
MIPGFVGSDMYETYLKSKFNCLYGEGCKGTPNMMNIAMHSRILANPMRSEALRNFVWYVIENEGVWIATRRNIAILFRENLRYKPGHLALGRSVGL